MRIQEVVILFATLLITRGGCRPNDKSFESDYMNEQGNDYNVDYPEDKEPENPSRDSTSSTTVSHIHTKPLKLEVDVGAQVQLPCNVSNSQSIVVAWKRGSSLLYSDDLPFVSDVEKTRIVKGRDNSLIIHNFRANDVSDEYICEISSVPTERVIHSIRLKKNVEVWPRDRVEVNNSNRTVNLRCNANWNPKPKVKWSHKGKSLTSDASPSDGSSLTIDNISVNEAGLYQCRVEIGGNSNPIVKGINVLVHHVPFVEVDVEVVHTGIHMESELSCVVSAYPQAEVRWYKDNREVTLGRKSKTEFADLMRSKHVLLLSRIERDDLGNYTCEARNSLGKAHGIVELTGVPKQASIVGGLVTGDGTVPTFDWEVQSYSPIIEYELKYRMEGDKEWHVENPRVTDDGMQNNFKIRYPIENLKAGKYEAVLRARNEFGWSPYPRQTYKFSGAAESKSGAYSTKSFANSRSIVLSALLLVYVTCL